MDSVDVIIISEAGCGRIIIKENKEILKKD